MGQIERAVKKTLNEIYSLFVDDAAFAAAIVLWLAAIGAAARLWPASTSWLAPLLFAGLALVLVVGVARSKRG